MKGTLNRLHNKLGLSTETIVQVYKSYWKFIRAKIEELPLKDDLDEEAFSRLRTNFNIPNLGKIHCTYPRYKVIKRINRRRSNDESQED